MNRPKIGERLQSRQTGQYYNVLSVKGENFRLAGDNGDEDAPVFWRTLKGWEDDFAVIDLRPDDNRIESLYYSPSHDEFVIVGINGYGSIYMHYIAKSNGKEKEELVPKNDKAEQLSLAYMMIAHDLELIGKL